MNIGPGSNVELILEMDVLKEKIDVRRAIIHDIEGDRYILSQTTPPVRPSDLGKDARVTRLTRKGDQLHRWGFSGKLEEIIREYPLNASRTVLALCIRKTSPFETYNLRMHYRVRPGSEWSTRIEVDSMPVNLIDISIGGALFSHGAGEPVRVQPCPPGDLHGKRRDAAPHPGRGPEGLDSPRCALQRPGVRGHPVHAPGQGAGTGAGPRDHGDPEGISLQSLTDGL